jgi:undecaprenyl-diphosphatase
VTQALQAYDPPWLVVLMRLVSWPGYAPQVVGVLVGLTGVFFLLGLRREGGSAVMAGVSALALNHLLKLAVERPRPTPDLVRVLRELADFSFPSGHVMFYTAFFGFLGFLAFTLLRPSWRRSLLILLSGLLVALVGPSRIYLGNHWASDVLVGYLLGSLVLAAAVQIYLQGRNP